MLHTMYKCFVSISKALIGQMQNKLSLKMLKIDSLKCVCVCALVLLYMLHVLGVAKMPKTSKVRTT